MRKTPWAAGCWGLRLWSGTIFSKNSSPQTQSSLCNLGVNKGADNPKARTSKMSHLFIFPRAWLCKNFLCSHALQILHGVIVERRLVILGLLFEFSDTRYRKTALKCPQECRCPRRARQGAHEEWSHDNRRDFLAGAWYPHCDSIELWQLVWHLQFYSSMRRCVLLLALFGISGLALGEENPCTAHGYDGKYYNLNHLKRQWAWWHSEIDFQGLILSYAPGRISK